VCSRQQIVKLNLQVQEPLCSSQLNVIPAGELQKYAHTRDILLQLFKVRTLSSIRRWLEGIPIILKVHFNTLRLFCTGVQ
jgi:hypothetical protein